MTRWSLAAGAMLIALVAAPAFAQGNGHGSGQGNGNGQAKGHGAPPSRNELAPVASAEVPVAISATPIAWVDDATLLDPGTLALSLSAVRWEGAGVSEVDVPIVNVAMGLAPRFQLSASVPRTLGSSDPSGASGGVGTSFFGAKVQLWSDPKAGIKFAASPTLQLLGEGVAATLGPDESRTRWGVPVSGELDRGALRLYGGGGYFSPSIWFVGGALAVQTTPKLTINGGISHAWRGAEDAAIVPTGDPTRNEISGGAAYVLAQHVVGFASVGRTFATLDENGAGTTISGGVSFWFATSK